MLTVGEHSPVSAGNSGQELKIIAQIANDPAARAESARELFFLYFDRIERTIQRRLSFRGLPYDPASEHYGRVFDFVHRRVFSPESIAAAIAGFNPEIGPLAGWLLRRVDFAVRDWLKTVRFDRAAVSSVDPAQVENAPGPTIRSANASDPQEGIEETFNQLSPTQRACSILRILPVRPLNQNDLSLLVQVSGRPREELELQVRDISNSQPVDPAGMREQQLLSEMAEWTSWQRCQQDLSRRLRTFLIAELHLTESSLCELEQRAQHQTAGEIRGELQGLRDQPPNKRRNSVLQSHFSLCCHELYRCQRRLAELRKEYAAARPLLLLSYEQIASILGKSVASVTTHLHESRLRMERHLNQVKVGP